jgi:hypothetical protein
MWVALALSRGRGGETSKIADIQMNARLEHINFNLWHTAHADPSSIGTALRLFLLPSVFDLPFITPVQKRHL